MKKLTKNLLVKRFLAGIFVLGIPVCLLSCMGQLPFEPGEIPVNITGEISTTDITSAVLMLTNMSKTVDVTNFTITQPEWQPPAGNQDAQAPSISIANKPKRLEKKAQYVSPSDKDYQVVVSYDYDALDGKPAGSGTQTILIPLPLPRQIVEVFIFRNSNGDVIIAREINNSDPADLGTPTPENSLGEGSSPAIIPPEYRNRMATFVTMNMTKSQSIDSVNFHMGKSDYKIGRIGINDKQSIALGQGTWETSVEYTRDGGTKTLGPVNSIIVPSNDPQAVKEHYLYFYLNTRGNYAISQTWPPYPNDVNEDDLLPVDNGFGRGLVKIINNSYGIVEEVSVHNLKEISKFPILYDYSMFTPSVPIQYNKTGYVDIIGTNEFPIEGHADYLVQVRVVTNEGHAFVERKAYIKDQILTITIAANDINITGAQGAKITLNNRTSKWPVKIIGLVVRNTANAYQSSYFRNDTWIPNGDIASNFSAYQYVISTQAMPISAKAEFKALLTINGGGVSTMIEKAIDPAILYSNTTPDMNTRTITITDADIPQEIIDGFTNNIGAIVKLENKISSWPVDITNLIVINKARPAENTLYSTTTWNPNGSITNGNFAEQKVLSSTVMPINPGDEFRAMVTLHTGGYTETVVKDFSPAKLYSDSTPENNTRTITITDSDVTPTIKKNVRGKGATIIMQNNVKTDWSIQITGLDLVSTNAVPSQSVSYGSNTFDPAGVISNGGEGKQLVTSSDSFTMSPGIEYKACVYLTGYGGVRKSVNKTFTPAELYTLKDPAQNTRTITIRDTDVPDELKPPGIPPPIKTQGATVTIRNNVTSWPVEITAVMVQNKAITTQNTYYPQTEWDHPGAIRIGNNAELTVYGSTAMPIASGVEFEAQVFITYNGVTLPALKQFVPPELYSATLSVAQNTRTITITDTDVPEGVKDAYYYTRGAKVTIENHVKTEWPIQITSMKVINMSTNQSTTYSSTWTPGVPIDNGNSAVQMVMSSSTMPIKPGVSFKAEITISGNNNTAIVTKNFSPAVLYSTNTPDNNLRTITIVNTDIPSALQTPEPPLPPIPPAKPDIAGAKDGDIILIDGVEWVKVRTDPRNSDLVLLMLNGVTGPCVKYNDSGFIAEYFSTSKTPSIKTYVDNWYGALISPTLKKIAWNVALGVSPNQTSPGLAIAGEKNSVGVAFIPRLKDINNISMANGYRYWRSDNYPDDKTQGITWDMIGIIAVNGDSQFNATADNSGIYVRPCIWVTSKF